MTENYLEKLIDSAFKRASKISVKRTKNKLTYYKLLSIARIQSFADYILSRLRELKQQLPMYENLHPFYRAMVDLYIGGKDKYKFLIGCITWSERMLERFKKEYIQKVRYSLDIKLVNFYRKQFYGRAVSVLKVNEDKYNKLVELLKELNKLPDIDPNLPTIVVAGYPNVGKSTFISNVSTAKVKIAPYPFTTKTVHVGHYIINELKKIQLIDTPGIIKKDLKKLKDIELKAYFAIKYLAKIIIFIVDVSETSGFSINDQIELLNRLVENSSVPVYIIKSKIDIENKELPYIPSFVKAVYEANLTIKEECLKIFNDIIHKEKLV